VDGNGLSALGNLLDELVSAVATPAVFGAGAIFLGFVFVLSGWPKLRNPGIAAMAIGDFGVSRSPSPWMGLTLGAGELTLAFFLFLASASGSGRFREVVMGVAALVLLAFSVLLARALRSGDEFACRCFGGDASPISGRTFMRTGLLALAALLLLVAAPRDFGAPGVADGIAEVAIGGAVLATFGLLGSLRSLAGATR
jgi:methylamine utilization protein MauE